MTGKFSITELTELWGDLLNSGLDSFQMAEAIRQSVAGCGYGISMEGALTIAHSLSAHGGSAKCLRSQLETLVFVM